MRFLFIVVFITAISGLGHVYGQAVKYGNNETSDYSSSYKSSSYTYLMWDRNDDGDGNFINHNTPKFFYWDNDDSKLHYLLDTGNMSQLDAKFNRVVVESNSPSLTVQDRGDRGHSSLYLRRGKESKDRSQVVFGNNDGTNLWHIGLAYRCGKQEDRFHISTRNYLDDCSENYTPEFTMRKNGKIGIGITNPSSKLTVNGTAKAKEVIVEENVGADFVFEDSYSLPSLSELEQYIETHKHLPEIPSAEEMKQNGVKVGNLQMKLLQKIEEMTLHMIEHRKLIDRQQKLIGKQQKLIEKQQQELKQLKTKLMRQFNN